MLISQNISGLFFIYLFFKDSKDMCLIFNIGVKWECYFMNSDIG